MATWKMSRRKIFDLWECSVLCLLPWLSTDDGIDWERDGDVDAREEQHSVPLPIGSLPGHTGAPKLYGFKTDVRWVNQWMVTNWSKVSAFLDHSIPWGDWLSWKKASQSIMHWRGLTGLWLRPDFSTNYLCFGKTSETCWAYVSSQSFSSLPSLSYFLCKCCTVSLSG